MTPDEKRERRQMRHQLANQARTTLSMRFKLDHSAAQLRAAVRVQVDQGIRQAVENLRK